RIVCFSSAIHTAAPKTTTARMMAAHTRAPAVCSVTGLTALPRLDEQVADLLHCEREAFGAGGVARPMDGVAELPELVVAVRGEAGERAQPLHLGPERRHAFGDPRRDVRPHLIGREVAVLQEGVAGEGEPLLGLLEPVHLVEEERAVVLGLVEGADGVLGALQGLLIASPDSGETVGGKRLRHRRPHPGRSALPRGTAPAGGRGSRGRDRPTPGASPTRRTTGAPSVPPPRRAAAPPQRSGVAPSRSTRPETRLPGSRASLQATATYCRSRRRSLRTGCRSRSCTTPRTRRCSAGPSRRRTPRRASPPCGWRSPAAGG